MIRREGGILHEKVTHEIIGVFFEGYNELGYGFLESVYSAALADVLKERGHTVFRQLAVTVQFRGTAIAWQRLDMVVDDCGILEIKASRELAKIAPRQLYNYLKATNLEVGLLLHFGPNPAFYRLASPRGR